MWKKVSAPPILVSILWIAGSSITNYYVHRVYESHARVMAENVATIRASWAMQDALWRLEAVVMEAASYDRDEARSEADELGSAFQQHLNEAERTSFTEEERMLVQAVRERFAVYREHIDVRLQPPGLADLLTPQTAEKQRTIRLARAVAEPCRQLVSHNERILAHSAAQSTRLRSVVNMVRLGFLVAAPIVGVLCGVWVARGLSRSISEISVTLKDATGELDREVGSVEVCALDDLPTLQLQVQTIAERIRRVMNELQQSRHDAILSQRLAAVGELAAGVAHELRNPLTSVKLLIQTAAKRQGDSALQEKPLQVAKREIARMENTIQGLLDFARPPQLHRVPHDLRETVRRALNLVAGRANQQQVSIIEEFPAVPVVVDGDPEQLHQVFVNLSLNGIEAMSQGGQLRVTISAGRDTGGTCEVVFQDTGAGIPHDVLSRVFEPFVTGKKHGTGLGLAISRRIVAEHGGTLSAANRADGGAVLAVQLLLSETPGSDTIASGGVEVAAARPPARMSECSEVVTD